MTDETCDLCGHLWSRHDPADGKCDVADIRSLGTVANGACPCGRDLSWMQARIMERALAVLEANVIRE